MRIKIDNTEFPFDPKAGFTKTELQKQVATAKAHRRKLKKILKAAGKSNQKKEPQHQYVSSARVKFATMIEVGKRQIFSNRLQLPMYSQMAQKLKLHEPINEKVNIRLKEKPNGGVRYYCEFGLIHKTAQAMVADMIRYQFKPKSWQYETKGVRKAVTSVKNLFKSGFIYAAKLDIKSFFDSFYHDQITLGAIPIKKAITENVAIGKTYTFANNESIKVKAGLEVPDDHIHEYAGTISHYINLVTQQGIPQGSAASPIVASFFLSKVNLNLPTNVRVINYVDDFLILGKTPEKVINAGNALKSAIADLPVGNFELLPKGGSSFVSGIEFLGHVFKMDGNKNLSVQVSQPNIQKFNFEVSKRSARLVDLHDSNPKNNCIAYELVLELARYVLGWLLAFSEADNIIELEKHGKLFLDSDCQLFELDPDTITKNAKKIGYTKSYVY